MDNFDKIIKRKVEQFEVPYNDAHWSEMNGRLNTIRAARIRKNIFGSAAAVGVIAIASYFIFTNNKISIKDYNNIIEDNNTPEILTKEIVSNKDENVAIIKSSNKVKKEIVINEQILEKNNTEFSVEKNMKTNIVTINTTEDEKMNPSDKIVGSDNLVNAAFIVYNNKVCLGEEVSFESSENNQPISYTWNFGDGTISHEANPKHIYTDSHIYTVSLTLLNRQNGKEYTTIQNDIVTIMPTPKASFSYTEESIEHDDNKLKYPYTTFKVKEVNKQYSYKWTFGNEETSTSSDAKTIYELKEKIYSATLIVENSNGCINTSTVKVFNKNGMNLFAQSGINPNSNIAENKVFIPGALLGWDVQFQMTIIDKSGNLVYKTSDKNEPWNGRMNNKGQVLDVGVYLWQVITYDAEGTPHRHHGQINLVK